VAEPLTSEVILRSGPSAQAELPLAVAGTQRWIWESRFGPILVEVTNGVAFVNGEPVQPVERTGGPAAANPP